jgi:hypothetical protein
MRDRAAGCAISSRHLRGSSAQRDAPLLARRRYLEDWLQEAGGDRTHDVMRRRPDEPRMLIGVALGETEPEGVLDRAVSQATVASRCARSACACRAFWRGERPILRVDKVSYDQSRKPSKLPGSYKQEPRSSFGFQPRACNTGHEGAASAGALPGAIAGERKGVLAYKSQFFKPQLST